MGNAPDIALTAVYPFILVVTPFDSSLLNNEGGMKEKPG